MADTSSKKSARSSAGDSQVDPSAKTSSAAAIKTSTRSILALVQAKKLRRAAHELRKLEPMRKQVYGYDRLIAAIHSPITRAEKLFFEAQAMVPDLINNTEGDASTRGNRTRAAIRRLMTARTILRDDPEINTLFKRCLASLQEAENKISAAQGLAIRGEWAAAYKEIKEAANLDDSPDVQATRKLIAEHYRVQAKDEDRFKKIVKTAKIGVFLMVLLVIGILILQCQFQMDVEDAKRAAAAEEAKRRQMAATRALVTADPESPPPVAHVPGSPVIPPPAVPGAVTPALPPVAGENPADKSAEKTADKNSDKNLEIRADNPQGITLGVLPPGTKITLRYQSGVWMAWRRANGGVSPDEPSEGGLRHSLAIRALKPDGTSKLLKVVPHGTKNTPFTYEVIGKYNAIFLVMNNDGYSFDNGDGMVTYGVQVVKP